MYSLNSLQELEVSLQDLTENDAKHDAKHDQIK